MMTDYQWLFISSTIVKAAASHGADVKGLVPENVRRMLMEKYDKGEVRRGTPCLSAPHGGFRIPNERAHNADNGHSASCTGDLSGRAHGRG